MYNNWYLLIIFRRLTVVLFGLARTTVSNLNRTISTNCCIFVHTVVPPDDGFGYARNIYRLTKYTKKKLCIMLVFLYTIISRYTVNKT